MPIHELMQSARLSHEVFAGAQVQVVGIAEQNLRADLLHLPGGHGLHARRGAHGHIDRRLNIPVRCMQHAQPRSRLCARMNQLIRKRLTHQILLLL